VHQGTSLAARKHAEVSFTFTNLVYTHTHIARR
jgi:hypothetical protein